MAAVFSMAAPVSESVAMQQAQAFLATRGKMTASLTMAPARRGMETAAPYYAFNVGNDGGFVLVSGDDALKPILGYADQGEIDLNDLPEGLRYMLDCYAAASSARTPATSTYTLRTPIAPLIQTRWNQNDPYDRNTPYYSNLNKHAPTGCTATAMAQVMKYWNWPQAVCQPLPGYLPTTNPNDTVTPVPATTFDWTNMQLTYTGDESDTEKDAVANLMEYCGKSVQMKYGSGSSSARAMSISYALKTYYDYDAGVQFVYRQHYSYADWINLLYSELAAGRPVCYTGQSAGGGHSFVCDGYDTDDFFHFNWGWSGKSDGYFRLVNPNPHDQGTGGSSTEDGYSMDDGATIGIQPSTQPTGKNYCLIQSETTIYTSAGHQNIKFLMRSHKNGTNLFDVNLRLYNLDGSLFRDLWTWDSKSIRCFYGQYLTYHFYDDSIPDGTYLVKPFSRLHGETEWKECMDWESQQLTLTVTNGHDTTTIRHTQGVLPVNATWTVSGSQEVGSRLTVTAHVTGGDADYSNNLILCVNGTKKMGFQTDIPAGQTRDLVFWYIPTAAGNDTLSLYADESFTDQIGVDTIITIQAGSVVSEQVALNKSIIYRNVSNNRFFGGHVQASVIYSNPSADTTYYGYMQVNLYEKLPGASTFPGHKILNYKITVPPMDSVVIDVDEKDLVLNAKYALRAFIRRDTPDGYEWTYTTGAQHVMGAGYELYAQDGSSTLYPLHDTLNLGAAAFADLHMLSTTDNVRRFVPSTNPNCVYLLNDSATLTWAAGLRNTVRGGHADSLSLLDGHAFFTPVEFTATNVTYKRPYQVGYSTICLPFDVPQVPGGLLTFADEAPGELTFSGVYHSLEANTPYLFIGDRHS
ncbi:MAG: C10 family peptidase, partial [Paludibacteraceae bacterium]|nr:C10 family peptidase [Paludibacteraceae bacterium]